jgi:hypothetical protein
LIILIALLTCFVNQVHHSFVDQAAIFSDRTDLDWQENVQIAVTAFDLRATPHVYRFLPNGIVLWIQLCRIKFAVARDIYRWIFGLLVFYALYRFARAYTDYLGGICRRRSRFVQQAWLPTSARASLSCAAL